MRIDIVTLFPEMFPGPLGESIIGRAAERNLAEIHAVDLRRYAHDARGTVDDKPYGGGPGMLMKVEPLVEAVEDLRRPGTVVILTSPRGERFTDAVARELAQQQLNQHRQSSNRRNSPSTLTGRKNNINGRNAQHRRAR